MVAPKTAEPEQEHEKNITVLTGNGLSIAFEPTLSLSKVTEELAGRIIDPTDGDPNVLEILKKHHPSAETVQDFEALVAPFVSLERELDLCQNLVKGNDENLEMQIDTVRAFSRNKYDLITSHVLQIIGEKSRYDQKKGRNLEALVRAIAEEFKGKITFANLNYDTLLLAALMKVCPDELADLADGRKVHTINVQFNGKTQTVQQLRKSIKEFPTRAKRLWLTHLHGSLTYWEIGSGSEKEFVKVPRDLVEGGELWRNMRKNQTHDHPCVVLSNQDNKTQIVENYPFKEAYRLFEKGLGLSTHWLIIGYSFRDEPVNYRLKSIFGEKDEKPKVVVVTHGGDLSTEKVEEVFGWEDGDSSKWLSVCPDGVNEFLNTDYWKEFTKN